MRGCPECKAKLGFWEILKSAFRKSHCIKCSNCNTELTIRNKGITNWISAIFGALVGIYLYRLLNYTVGTLFSFILIVTSAFIIEILLMVIATSVIGFKKRYE